MLNLIPTPRFAEISETKTLNVKSIVINVTDINQDAIDDFYAFLSKINIQNGNGSQIEFFDDGGQGDLSSTRRNGSNRMARRQHLRTVCQKFGLLLFISR